MEERETEIPVATLRPRRLSSRVVAARGALGRWLRDQARAAFVGRHVPLLLTGVFFSAMMLAMGYIADRAQLAAEGIDEAHRAAALERAAEQRASHERPDDPWAAAATRPRGTQVLMFLAP